MFDIKSGDHSACLEKYTILPGQPTIMQVYKLIALKEDTLR